MAVPTYIGNTSTATLIEENATVDHAGFDALSQTWEMRQADVRAFVNALKVNELPTESISYSAAEYNGMYLKSVVPHGGGSPFSTVVATYQGFLQTRNASAPYVDRNDDINLAASTLPTSAGESVEVMYYGQQTTYRWFSSGEPRSPRFPATVPANVPVNQIVNASPANYNGTLQMGYVGRLVQFNRVELAPGKWAVVESWMRRIEPAS